MRPVRKPLCRGGPGFNGLLIELGLEPRSYVASRIRINKLAKPRFGSHTVPRMVDFEINHIVIVFSIGPFEPVQH